MWAMLELLSVMFGLLRAMLRGRADLVAENLLLRQQLAVLTPPRHRGPGSASATNWSGY